MLLADVKKLKVVELRDKLRERGLDYRGLKAELVARLVAAGQEPTDPGEEPTDPGKETTDSREEPKHPGRETTDQDTWEEPTSRKDKAPEEPCHISTEVAVEHAEGVCGVPRPEESGQIFVDQGTQTEQPAFCSCFNGRKNEGSKPGSSEPSQEQRTPCYKSPEVHYGGGQEVSRPVKRPACSPLLSQPVCTSAVSQHDHSSWAPDTMDTGVECEDVRRPDGEKGRDYYEFKEEIQYNRAKTPEPGPESEDDMEVDDDDVVRLDIYNSDLHFEVGPDGCSGQPLLWEKFPLLQSGCRLTHGFSQGKAGFEVKFLKKLSSSTVDMSLDPEPQLLRVGWSVESASLQLGEEELSFGLDGAGRAVTGGKVDKFGEPFSEGDIIGCYAFISEGGQAELSFHKNGHALGVAFRVNSSILAGQALYPHVLCKSCSVSLNLDPQGTVWYPGPPGFCSLPVLPQRTRAPLPPPHRKDCEVLMMVGMPGSGKSHWAQSHMAKNPEKCYSVLSTNAILHSMRLPGPEHKEVLLQQATQCLTHLIRIAANKRRNFILDQANIYPSARKHKMLRFRGYQRRAVVVVPADVEWTRRLQRQREDGGVEVPEMSLLKSKVSFTLPEQGELLEEVLFAELPREEAEKLLTAYKEEARCLLPAPPKRRKRQNKYPKLLTNPHVRGYGWSPHPSSLSQWGQQKQYGWQPTSVVQPYGCNSDPQCYRDYYQPCTGQWSTGDQSQSYYSNQDYYFGNQVFW